MKSKLTKEELELCYTNVVKLVENGYNISDSLKKLGVSRVFFYDNISEHQKTYLRSIKATKAISKRLY